MKQASLGGDRKLFITDGVNRLMFNERHVIRKVVDFHHFITTHIEARLTTDTINICDSIEFWEV